MSTPQSIAFPATRVRVRHATLLTALGVLVAVAVTVVMLTLVGANHTTVTTPVTSSQAAVGSTPQTHYLGPQQTRAGLNPTTVQGDASGAATGGPAAHYSCLGAAQRCLR
jgi:hypothetical protein